MSRIKQKFIRFGTGTDDVNARLIPANFTPSSYTPIAVGAEATTQVSAHLKGIDTTLGALGATTGDIGLTTFNAANNQAAAANITGFAFANATVRAFDALVSVALDATTDLFAVYRIRGIQKSADWDISVEFTGDDTGIEFSITNAGQMQYTSANSSGYVSNKLSFRCQVTQI